MNFFIRGSVLENFRHSNCFKSLQLHYKQLLSHQASLFLFVFLSDDPNKYQGNCLSCEIRGSGRAELAQFSHSCKNFGLHPFVFCRLFEYLECTVSSLLQ